MDEVKLTNSSNGAPTILIVEDDLDIADMLTAYFRAQGYVVQSVNWGEDGVRAAAASMPDLIILDIRLPDIDGFEVARRLRSTRKTAAIPIIFCTEKRGRGDRLKGLELQADDYITKPFDVQELRLRVRNALQRARQSSLTNPVTGMPEGHLVDEALVSALTRGGTPMSVSLRNLDHFREVYGFVAADDLLRAVGVMLRDHLRDNAGSGHFLGHLSGTVFLIVTYSPGVGFKERLQQRLNQSFDFFYSDQHRESGEFAQAGLAAELVEVRLDPANLPTLEGLKHQLEGKRRNP